MSVSVFQDAQRLCVSKKSPRPDWSPKRGAFRMYQRFKRHVDVLSLARLLAYHRRAQVSAFEGPDVDRSAVCDTDESNVIIERGFP